MQGYLNKGVWGINGVAQTPSHDYMIGLVTVCQDRQCEGSEAWYWYYDKQANWAGEGSAKLLLMQSIVEKTKEGRICGRAL